MTAERVWRAMQQAGRRRELIMYAVELRLLPRRLDRRGAASCSRKHPGAKLLAGGHSLIPLLKLRLAAPRRSSTSAASPS